MPKDCVDGSVRSVAAMEAKQPERGGGTMPRLDCFAAMEALARSLEAEQGKALKLPQHLERVGRVVCVLFMYAVEIL